MAHPALGDDVPGEVPHIAHRPFSTATSRQLSWSKCKAARRCGFGAPKRNAVA
jgi:hypothetical protein